MFPFLTVFIIFLVILTYHIKKNDAAQAKVQDEFWEKERKSNAVRKQDISKLDYITIPLDKLPHRLDSETENAFFALSEKTMVNLTGISNTDLKLTYGTANLALLSEYDVNFMEWVALLPTYAQELLDAGYEDSAQLLLEFAVECNADSARIYSMLISIYRSQNATEKLNWLRERSENLPQFTRLAVQKELA